MAVNRFASDEARLIERLNAVSPLWRDKFEDVHSAAARLLSDRVPGATDAFDELDAAQLGYGYDEGDCDD